MTLINFQAWSPNALIAYATVLTLAFIVLALVFIFRELGTRKHAHVPMSDDSAFGFRRSRGETQPMEVVQIRQLSDDIKNFRLRPLQGYRHYSAGQFLTFHLGDDQTITRCYSLNSSPSRPGLYEVAVKRLEGGRGSGWMHDHVRVGDTLQVTNPAGRFCLETNGQITILVAGGIGITPMMSMLTEIVDSGISRPVYLFYTARTRKDLVFHAEIVELTSRSPAITYVPLLSRPDDDWTGEKGRLSEDIMVRTGVDFSRAELYTCGPAPVMELAKSITVQNGMPPKRFHNEIFASPTSIKMVRRQCTVRVDGQTLNYDSDRPLLDFLLDHDVNIPYSCRAGVCGTCAITLESGDVESLPSEFLDENDLAAGRRLSCICFPKSDVTITAG